MKISLVLIFVGKDRPGLIHSLTNIVTSFDGSWQQSHMRQMAGLFAGMALVTIDDADRDAVLQELRGVEGLSLLIEAAPGSEPALRMRGASLNLVGPDQPGLLDSVIHELSLRGANMLEVDTHMTGNVLSNASIFIADMALEVPDTVDIPALAEHLELLGERLNVEILLEEDYDE